MKTNVLSLELPENFSSSVVTDWMSQLPLTSVNNSINAITELLERLLLVEVAPALRFELIGQLSPKVFDLVAILQKKLNEGRFPLSSRLEMEVEDGSRLLIAMIENHEHLIGCLNKRRSLRLLEQAAKHFYALQYLSLRAYKIVPAGFWKSLYKFFIEGEQVNGFFSKKNTDKQAAFFDQIKKIFLLHIAAPHRLYLHEITLAAKLAEYFAPRLILSRNVALTESRAGLFYFHHSRGEPPRHVDFLDNSGEDFLLVSTTKIIDDIKTEAGVLARQREYQLLGLSGKTMKKIVKPWWRPSQRKHAVRKAVEGHSVQLIIGAESIMRWVRYADVGNEFLQSLPRLSTSVVNRDNGGCCLQWSYGEDMCHLIRVGELVGVVVGEVNPHLELAITRWVLNAEEGIFRMGVQLLTPIVKSIQINSEDFAEHQNVLLLPPLPSLGNQASLIAANQILVTGQEISAGLGDTVEQFAIQNRIRTGIGFEQYAVTQLI